MGLQLSPHSVTAKFGAFLRDNRTFFAVFITTALISALAIHFSTRPTSADAINATDFVITIKTDNAGTSNATSFTLPTISGQTYNYGVDWNNDGVVDQTGITGAVTH